MSTYSASLPSDVRQVLIQTGNYSSFERDIDKWLLEAGDLRDDAPELPPLHRDYHAAADRFARTVTARRAPKCTIFQPPANPQLA